MDEAVRKALEEALARVATQGGPNLGPGEAVPLERSRVGGPGELASPVALMLAKKAGAAPRTLAHQIAGEIETGGAIESVEVAGEGFINIRVATSDTREAARKVLEAGAKALHPERKRRQKIQVEFVSSNPTGPLHVGHGRGAAFGDALASILEACGHDVDREYYVNDAGRQMDVLATSVWLRALQAQGADVPFPKGCYQGSYIETLAQASQVPAPDPARTQAIRDAIGSDGETRAERDACVDQASTQGRQVLGKAAWKALQARAEEAMLRSIQADMEQMGVSFDRWQRESALVRSGCVTQALERIASAGHSEVRKGATWLRSKGLGDTKDRVLVRSDGQPTYLASDVGYLADKQARGYDRTIYVWGADHHGYVARLKAAARALGIDPGTIDVVLLQMVSLRRAGAHVKMSTRAGEMVALKALLDEVGADVARFYYVARRADQALELDVELAKAGGKESPVHYVQYAHARIVQVEAQAGAWEAHGSTLDHLVAAEEEALLEAVAGYSPVLSQAAERLEPHRVAQHLVEIARALHRLYARHPILGAEEPTRTARLALLRAVRLVLADGLKLLGIQAADTM